jgi:hypothetical protein
MRHPFTGTERASSQNRLSQLLQLHAVMGHTLGSKGSIPKLTCGSRADGSADFKNCQ